MSSTVRSTSSLFWQGVWRGSVFIGLFFLLVPFGPLLILGLISLAGGGGLDGSSRNPLIGGGIGSGVCLYLMAGAGWRRRVIVGNATTPTHGAVANAPVASGTWHAAWTPRASGPQACGAATLPKPDRYGYFGMLSGGSWTRGGW